jgi:hypothetical protein
MATASRWLHVYLSMVSFGILLFFAVTGLTLNHAEALSGKQKSTRYSGSLERSWLQAPAKLEIVEYLRAHHGIKGALSEFRVDDGQLTVAFRGPGYSADALIDRANGKYDLTEIRMGAVAVMNDLHKGRDAGTGWSWMIDASAVLMSLVSITGLALIFFLPKRRFSGLILAGVGLMLCYVVYVVWVP